MPNELQGIYTVTYIEENGQAYMGQLIITIQANRIYNLKWNINIPTPVVFQGTGLQTGEKQLTVIYWKL